jgi:hypothetical protein
MVSLAINAIIYSIAMLSSWLEGKDKNDTGADDAIAAALDVFGQLLKEYKDNGVSKKVILLALEITEVLLAKMDSNATGVDDKLAEKVGQLKKLLG